MLSQRTTESVKFRKIENIINQRAEFDSNEDFFESILKILRDGNEMPEVDMVILARCAKKFTELDEKLPQNEKKWNRLLLLLTDYTAKKLLQNHPATEDSNSIDMGSAPDIEALEYFSKFTNAQDAGIEPRYVALYTVGLTFAFIANYPNYKFAGDFGVKLLKAWHILSEDSTIGAEVWAKIFEISNYVVNLFVNAKSFANSTETLLDYIQKGKYKDFLKFTLPALCASIPNIQFARETANIKSAWGLVVAGVGFIVGVSLSLRGLMGPISTSQETEEAAVSIRYGLITRLTMLLPKRPDGGAYFTQTEIKNALSQGQLFDRKYPLAQQLMTASLSIGVTSVYSLAYFNAAVDALETLFNNNSTQLGELVNTSSGKTWQTYLEDALSNLIAGLGFATKAGLLSYATYILLNKLIDNLFNKQILAEGGGRIQNRTTRLAIQSLLVISCACIGLLSTTAAMGSSFDNFIDQILPATIIGFGGAYGINTNDLYGFISTTSIATYDLFKKKVNPKPINCGGNAEDGIYVGHLFLDRNQDNSEAFDKLILAAIRTLVIMPSDKVVQKFAVINNSQENLLPESSAPYEKTIEFSEEYYAFIKHYRSLRQIKGDSLNRSLINSNSDESTIIETASAVDLTNIANSGSEDEAEAPNPQESFVDDSLVLIDPSDSSTVNNSIPNLMSEYRDKLEREYKPCCFFPKAEKDEETTLINDTSKSYRPVVII